MDVELARKKVEEFSKRRLDHAAAKAVMAMVESVEAGKLAAKMASNATQEWLLKELQQKRVKSEQESSDCGRTLVQEIAHQQQIEQHEAKQKAKDVAIWRLQRYEEHRRNLAVAKIQAYRRGQLVRRKFREEKRHADGLERLRREEMMRFAKEERERTEAELKAMRLKERRSAVKADVAIARRVFKEFEEGQRRQWQEELRSLASEALGSEDIGMRQSLGGADEDLLATLGQRQWQRRDVLGPMLKRCRPPPPHSPQRSHRSAGLTVPTLKEYVAKGRAHIAGQRLAEARLLAEWQALRTEVEELRVDRPCSLCVGRFATLRSLLTSLLRVSQAVEAVVAGADAQQTRARRSEERSQALRNVSLAVEPLTRLDPKFQALFEFAKAAQLHLMGEVGD